MSEAFHPSTFGKYAVSEGVKCNACLAIEQRSKDGQGHIQEGLYFDVHLKRD